MKYVNQILNGLFDTLLQPLAHAGAWPIMILLSFLTALVAMLIFKATSDQVAIRARKNRVIARILEFGLFKNDSVVSITAFPRVLSANLAYLGPILKPLLLCLIPIFIIMIQARSWLEVAPLRPGETAIIKARVSRELPVMAQNIAITCTKGIELETPPVRIPANNEICWRIRAINVSPQSVTVSINNNHLHQSVTISDGPSRITAGQSIGNTWHKLTHPSELTLPNSCGLERITVTYPKRSFPLFGVQANWSVVFIAMSLAWAMLLMKPLKVTF